MTRVAGDPHDGSSRPIPPLVYFSPNGRQFLVVLRSGNLRDDMIDSSIALFRTNEVFYAPKPEILVNMASRGDHDPIRRVEWIDNQSFAFLGEDEEGVAQVYSFSVTTRRLRKRTSHKTRVVDFRLSPGSDEIVFEADGKRETADIRVAAAMSGTDLAKKGLPAGLDCPGDAKLPPELFRQDADGKEERLSGKSLASEQAQKETEFRQDRQIGTPEIRIAIEEGINIPPRLRVADRRTNRSALLLDLNPQFAAVNFAKVEWVNWKTKDGKDVINGGGLYLPPDYVVGKKYPLVIQTHHFQTDIFMIDGPWAAGYAAQALAARGIVVLQVHHAAGYYQNAATPEEAPGEMAMYEGAIDYLDARGLIDRDRVGIYAYSRSVYHVAYTLTHSRYAFAAAILEDGVDEGYLSYLSSPVIRPECDRIYGGPPYGKTLKSWIKDSPGFSLDRVRTPVRIVEHGCLGVLQQWEWFSGLTLLHKPVDMLVLSGQGYGQHSLKTPSQRMISQESAVDWFCFWLKDEELSDASGATDYIRWRELKELEKHGD